MQLASDLERILRELIRLVRSQTSAGLSITALATLARLADAGPCRVTDLAARESVTQPSMTALVGRLEVRGLVTRGPDPDDRRAVRVSITEAGRAQVLEVRAARTALLEERIAALDADDRDALAAALPTLSRLLEPPS